MKKNKLVGLLLGIFLLGVGIGFTGQSGDIFATGDPNTNEVRMDSNGSIIQSGSSVANTLGGSTVTGLFIQSGRARQAQGNSGSSLALSTSTSLTTTNLDKSFMVITSTGGAITVGSLPTIATTTATNGDYYTILSATATVTFSDNDSVAGTLLELGSTTRALGVGDILKLRYYNGKWYEEGFFNN